jgi:hypothetical protein
MFTAIVYPDLTMYIKIALLRSIHLVQAQWHIGHDTQFTPYAHTHKWSSRFVSRAVSREFMSLQSYTDPLDPGHNQGQ